MLFLFGAMLCGCSTTLPTPTPSPTPIPGWKEFSAPGVSLWLPDTYQGGDLENDLDLITEQLKTRGPEYEAVAAMIEQNRSAFTIWTFDSATGADEFDSRLPTFEQSINTLRLEQ